MNRWLQTKQYPCAACRQPVLHDRMYFHAMFTCLRRTPATPIILQTSGKPR